MASNLRKNLEEQVTCAICQEHFTDPRLLPCLHTYCKECLADLVRAASRKDQISCPECRRVVQITDTDGVDQLKANFQMNNLISLLAITSVDDVKQTALLCENCTINDTANGRCVDCCKFMCEFCIKAHQRFLETRDHTLMSLAEVRKQGTSVISQQSKCAKHKSEVMKLYCEDCEQLICRDCTIIDHRDHCYQFIDDVAEQHKKGLKAVLEEAIGAECELVKHKNVVEEMQLKINLKCENIEKEITVTINRQVEALKQKEKSLRDDVRKLAVEKIKHLGQQAQEFEERLMNLNSSIKFTKDTLQDNDNTTILSVFPEANNQLSTLVEEMRSINNQPCEEDSFLFQANVESTIENIDNGMYITDKPAVEERCDDWREVTWPRRKVSIDRDIPTGKERRTDGWDGCGAWGRTSLAQRHTYMTTRHKQRAETKTTSMVTNKGFPRY